MHACQIGPTDTTPLTQDRRISLRCELQPEIHPEAVLATQWYSQKPILREGGH